MRVAFRRYLEKQRKAHEFKLVDETSSYDPCQELIDTPFVLPTTQVFRQSPRKRILQENQLESSYT